MRSEIRAEAKKMAEMGPGGGPGVEDRVGLELMARYGPDLGPRMVSDFVAAYGSAATA